MGTDLKVLSETNPMYNNTTGFRMLSIVFASLCTLDGSSLSIGRVKDNLLCPMNPVSHGLINKRNINYPLPYFHRDM